MFAHFPSSLNGAKGSHRCIGYIDYIITRGCLLLFKYNLSYIKNFVYRLSMICCKKECLNCAITWSLKHFRLGIVVSFNLHVKHSFSSWWWNLMSYSIIFSYLCRYRCGDNQDPMSCLGMVIEFANFDFVRFNLLIWVRKFYYFFR